jgi:hypothetical protein
MRSYLDVMLLTQSDSFHHDQRVSSMKPAGDIGMIDDWQKLFIRAAFVIAILSGELLVDAQDNL